MKAVEPTPIVKAPKNKNDALTLQQQARELRRQADELEAQARGLVARDACREAAGEIRARTGRVAVFLGAGASKTFGWPLTNELLPIIIDGLIRNDLFEDDRINNRRQNAADRRLLRKTLLALCPGLLIRRDFLNQSKDRLPLVTSLLSMLDFSLMAGHAIVSGLTPEELTDARILLERAIYEAIAHQEEEEEEHYWPVRRSNELAPQLTRWLDRIRRDQTQVAVITSNYDVAIEQAWGFKRYSMPQVSSLGVDFGFDWTWPSAKYPPDVLTRPQEPKRRLYKLHGSTNWLRCGLCDRMYIDPSLTDIAIFAYDRVTRQRNMCHCGHAKLEVQIVSPSFIREVQSPNLIGVWQRALNWLRQSDDWIVIGYSFPDEDLNIRSLFTRALASRTSPPHMTVIQFGSNEQTRIRYEAFFPVEQLRFLTGGLEAFLEANIRGVRRKR